MLLGLEQTATRSGLYSTDELHLAALAGKHSGRGLVDMWVFNHALKKFFLGSFLDSYSFSSAAKDSLRTIYALHDSFRERVSPFDVDGSEPDATIFSNYSTV